MWCWQLWLPSQPLALLNMFFCFPKLSGLGGLSSIQGRLRFGLIGYFFSVEPLLCNPGSYHFPGWCDRCHRCRCHHCHSDHQNEMFNFDPKKVLKLVYSRIPLLRFLGNHDRKMKLRWKHNICENGKYVHKMQIWLCKNLCNIVQRSPDHTTFCGTAQKRRVIHELYNPQNDGVVLQ